MKLPRPEGVARCPRCDSEDTKFCYYNNYNVKQPRYFCKVCSSVQAADSIIYNPGTGLTQPDQAEMDGRPMMRVKQLVSVRIQPLAPIKEKKAACLWWCAPCGSS